MSYKIAVASSDEIHIDESFGSAKAFHIYEVTEEGYIKAETRKVTEETDLENGQTKPEQEVENTSGNQCQSTKNCGNGGCSGSGGGCSGSGEISGKVELVSDCRCIVCKKIGFHVQKQLERKAITSFDVDCTVEEALKKISSYFQKVDTHQSLRGSSK